VAARGADLAWQRFEVEYMLAGVHGQTGHRGGKLPATRRGGPRRHGCVRPPRRRHQPAGVAQTTWDIYARLRRQGPNTQRRFEHAKGMTRATCHSEQAMCAESFSKTDASGPTHSTPCLPCPPSSSVRKVFRCTCGRGRHRLLPRKGRATSGVRFAVILELKP
jgi:hypothetical protein